MRSAELSRIKPLLSTILPRLSAVVKGVACRIASPGRG
jgi:hypothetical protein